MILKAAGLRAFMKSPNPNKHTALIYGKDIQRVRDLALEFATLWGSNNDDPFARVIMTDDDLMQDPARLEDEWRSLTLMGSGRVITLRGSSPAATKAITDCLRDIDHGLWQPAGKLIVEAGELRKTHALRKAAEGHAGCVVVPLYEEDDKSLLDYLASISAGYSISVDEACMQAMIERLGSDRGMLKAEIDKLCLYVADRPGARAGLDDWMQLSHATGEVTLGHIVDAVLQGAPDVTDHRLMSALQSGLSIIGLLRILQQKLVLLLQIKEQTDAGMSLGSALQNHRPPLFGSGRSVIQQAARHWTTPRLREALRLTLDLESRLKETGGHDAAEIGLLLSRFARIKPTD